MCCMLIHADIPVFKLKKSRIHKFFFEKYTGQQIPDKSIIIIINLPVIKFIENNINYAVALIFFFLKL